VSQEDLARRADRHFTYIGRIERGEQNVHRWRFWLEISAALETRPEDLLAEGIHYLPNGGSPPPMWSRLSAMVFVAQVDVKGKLGRAYALSGAVEPAAG